MRDHPATARELRRFGLTFGSGLTVVGSFLLWKEKAPAPYLLGAAAIVILAGLIYPKVLRPLEALLAKLFELFTTVVTYVVLTATFFFVITPIGLLLRLFGKDNLLLRTKRADTYWRPVEPDGPGTRPDQPY